jgi:hypothetical protein
VHSAAADESQSFHPFRRLARDFEGDVVAHACPEYRKLLRGGAKHSRCNCSESVVTTGIRKHPWTV